MLITITGPDGSGKSSITKRIYSEQHGQYHKKIQLVDRWDIFQNKMYPECDFITAPIKQIKESISSMESYSRCLFIFWKIYTVMKSYDPTADNIVILDSYWIKHAAVEVEYGVEEKFVLSVVDKLPISDKVLVLDVDPEVAYERKLLTNDFVPYECGMDQCLSKESFISHQNKLRNRLLRWAEVFGWEVLDGTEDINSVTSNVKSKLFNSSI